jgi:hypothetical protein
VKYERVLTVFIIRRGYDYVESLGYGSHHAVVIGQGGLVSVVVVRRDLVVEVLWTPGMRVYRLGDDVYAETPLSEP